MLQTRAARRDLLCRLHCGCVLCHSLSPSRHRRFQVKPREGINCGRGSEAHGFRRYVERSRAQDHYDRYVNRRTMVHLRCIQSCNEHAAPSSARNARVAQEEISRRIELDVTSTWVSICSVFHPT